MLLESGELSNDDLPRVYDALLVASPLVEKPPFFGRRPIARLFQTILWGIARSSPLLHPVFERLFAPKGRPQLVFKEVNRAPLMAGMVDRTDLRCIYIVRRPFGVVASRRLGQEQGLLPTGHLRDVSSQIRQLDPVLADELGPADRLTDLQRNALLWRIEVEKGIEAANRHDSVLLVVYEDLCMNPRGCTRRILEHFGMEFAPEVESFLGESTRPRALSKFTRAEFLVSNFFTVYRDPVVSMNKWRHLLSESDKAQILQIVEPSPAYAQCVDLGYWPPTA